MSGYPTELTGLVGAWVGLVLTVGLYSYMLYKENPLYRLTEHIYLGTAFGVIAITAVKNTQRVAIQPLLGGEIVYIIPIILGLMMYATFTKEYRWISRYPIAALVGTMLAVQITGVLKPNIINQLVTTITPPTDTSAMGWFNFLFTGIGTICALSYFLLTREHTGVLEPTSKVGRWLIMLGLGTMFGNTVLFRMTMLSGRIEYILKVLKMIPW